jgi:hypothetical protein
VGISHGTRIPGVLKVIQEPGGEHGKHSKSGGEVRAANKFQEKRRRCLLECKQRGS